MSCPYTYQGVPCHQDEDHDDMSAGEDRWHMTTAGTIFQERDADR